MKKKRKKRTDKLALSRRTVRKLSTAELDKVAGGTETLGLTGFTCFVC